MVSCSLATRSLSDTSSRWPKPTRSLAAITPALNYVNESAAATMSSSFGITKKAAPASGV